MVVFDVFIIEKIEEEERRQREALRPSLSIPSVNYPEEPLPKARDIEAPERGVVVIDPDDP